MKKELGSHLYAGIMVLSILAIVLPMCSSNPSDPKDEPENRRRHYHWRTFSQFSRIHSWGRWGGESRISERFRQKVMTGWVIMKFTPFIAIVLVTLSAACSKSTGPEPTPPQSLLDPGIIVFVSDRETSPRLQLFTMNSDGSDPVRLTHDSNNYRCPLFSPDGSKILFYSQTTDGSDEIYAVDADGSDLVNLSNAPGDDHCPRYSPDGSRIVFASSRDGNLSLIHI